jgi:hypothetical protein
MTLIAYRSHFAILANDAFPLLFQAESLSWSNPRSFYNGFFPVGYPFLLRILLLFGRQHIDATGVLFNIALSAGLIWCLMKLMVAQSWSKWWAVLAVTVALFLPEMLRGVLSLRPDYIVTVLATAAFLCYQRKRFDLAGLLLGVSCLFRTHALALVIAFALAGFIFHGKRDVGRLLLSALPFLLLQGFLNLAAGEAFLSSTQGFNVAKMIYGADWRQDQLAPPSTLSIVLAEPVKLLQAYLGQLLSEWYLLLPLVVSLVFKRTREFALIGLLYFLAVGFGGSPRGSLPIQPIAVVCLFGMIAPFLQRRRIAPSTWLPATIVIVIFVGSFVLLERSAAKAGARLRRYQDVGNRLGLRHADHAKQILTDDFAMYFPQIRNASPYMNGGWGPIGIPLYRERIPQFMFDDPIQLHDSLSKRGVKMIVLNQPSTDPRLQATVLKDSTLFFRQNPDISGYAVYRVR